MHTGQSFDQRTHRDLALLARLPGSTFARRTRIRPGPKVLVSHHLFPLQAQEKSQGMRALAKNTFPIRTQRRSCFDVHAGYIEQGW